MSRRGVFYLVPEQLSEDTLEALEVLMRRAKSGRIIGLAWVVMYKERRYSCGVTGECRRDPTYTRGMLGHLDDLLGEMQNGSGGR